MKITAYQSGKGDCLLLDSETGAKTVRVLVDGGLPESYRDHVAPSLAQQKTPLDLVYLSHIDEDHIGGVLQLMNDLIAWRVYDYQKEVGNPKAKRPDHPRPPDVRKIWHNSFHEQVGKNAGDIGDMLAASTAILSASTTKLAATVLEEHAGLAQSKYQALQLARRVGPGQLDIPVNPEFQHKLMMLRPGAPKLKAGSITFHLIGPFEKDLRKLRTEWNAWLKESK